MSNKAIKSVALTTAIISIFSIFFGGVETIDQIRNTRYIWYPLSISLFILGKITLVFTSKLSKEQPSISTPCKLFLIFFVIQYSVKFAWIIIFLTLTQTSTTIELLNALSTTFSLLSVICAIGTIVCSWILWAKIKVNKIVVQDNNSTQNDLHNESNTSNQPKY